MGAPVYGFLDTIVLMVSAANIKTLEKRFWVVIAAFFIVPAIIIGLKWYTDRSHAGCNPITQSNCSASDTCTGPMDELVSCGNLNPNGSLRKEITK